MAISTGDALSRAIERVRAVCFRPFNIGRWFILGFAAWLATLAEGGAGFPNNFGGSWRGGRGSGGPDVVWRWITAHAALVIVLSIGLAVLGLLVGVVLMWLRARGRFVLLDDIARNPDRDYIVEPWKRLGPLANRLFLFQLACAVIGLVLMGGLVGAGLLLAWPDIHARSFGWPAGIALIAVVPVYLLLSLAGMVIHGLTLALVMPLMYARHCGPVEGWRIVLRDILPGHLGAVLLFALLKAALFLAEAVITTLGMCLTCCLAALPYIRAVVFLPLHVFNLAFDAYFLEQFGPDFKVLPDLAAAPTGFPVTLIGAGPEAAPPAPSPAAPPPSTTDEPPPQP